MPDTPSSAPAAGPTGLAEQAFREAVQLHGQGRLVEAERLYDETLAELPDHAGALGYLGFLRAQQGRMEEAAALIGRAVARDPSAPDAHNNLGMVLQKLKRWPEAIRAHEQALALRRPFPEARFNLGMAQQAAGDGAAALATFATLAAEAPDYADGRLQYGLLLRAAGRAAEAEPHLRHAVALDPKLAAQVGAGGDAAPDPRIAAERMNRFIGSFLTNQKNPRMTVYPGLSVRAVHDPARFPVVAALEAAYPEIKREIAVLTRDAFHPEAEGATDSGDWDVMLFWERGKRNDANCDRCPTITRIIESHPTVRTLGGLMYVSKTGPGTHIRAHRGPTNIRLRCHLGIQVPDGDVGLRVAEERLRWQEGRCIVFDDHLEHESWNHTGQDRIVLIIDLWHPDLTPTEVQFLEGLHRYAAYQANSLGRYWSLNAEARTKRRGYD